VSQRSDDVPKTEIPPTERNPSRRVRWLGLSEWWQRLLVALFVGVPVPFLELAWRCRADRLASESCVWARAYFPLTRWLEPFIAVPVVFALLTAVATRPRNFE